MSVHEAAVAILLSVGVGIEVLCCIGILVMRNAFDRLHYTGLASTLGPAVIAAAVVAAEAFSKVSLKAALIALLLPVTNAVLTHATARAAYIRRYGRWQPLPRRKDESL